MKKIRLDKTNIGILAISILLVAIVFIPESAYAQCPMCRIAAESNMKNGGSAGLGLNGGILYLLAMPYLFISVIGFIWWRSRKKKAELERELEQEA